MYGAEEMGAWDPPPPRNDLRPPRRPISKKCTWCNEGTWHYGVKTQSACQTLAQKAASNHYTYKPGPK